MISLRVQFLSVYFLLVKPHSGMIVAEPNQLIDFDVSPFFFFKREHPATVAGAYLSGLREAGRIDRAWSGPLVRI